MKLPGRFSTPKFILTVSFVVIAAGGFTATLLFAQDNLDTLRQAAEQGDADAQYSLGVKYALGRGVEKDDAEAVRWFREAAEQGDAGAQFNLGVLYAGGSVAPKDYALAHMWTSIAVATGFEEGRAFRDRLERDMTRAEIRRATELARACMNSDYQDCQQ